MFFKPINTILVAQVLFSHLLNLSNCQTVFPNGTISSDVYFYGQSEPIYPSPIGAGIGAWHDSYVKAKALVAQMTLTEKINITGGFSDPTSGCVGAITNITRLGFPGLCLQDAGNGVRATDFVNGYPGGLHVGASWNKYLSNQRGIHMGKEFRTKGVNVALGPVVGPLGRVSEGGRNWEGFANDPYLCGQLAAEAVLGIQSTGVITSTKHFILNEQETNRNPSTNTQRQSVASVSSNIDDKTLHEIYLWPFQDALYAGSGNIMCSYNRINNSYGCQNSKTLNGILKNELGFQGFVVSDWGAQHSGVGSALAGLDMVMPSATAFWGDKLAEAVNNGSVPVSRLDDMATRILATWYHFGQDSNYPTRGIGMPKNVSRPHPVVNARDPSSKPILFEGAVEGHVLVKNIKNALPLKSPKLLSIIGYDAKTPDTYQATMGQGGTWSGGSEPLNTTSGVGNQVARLGTMIMGGGSGAVTPAYWNAPFDALQERAYADGTSLFWDFATPNSNSPIEGATDACLVFINAWASEGADRPGLHDDFSDALVLNIAAQCANTIVVIHNVGIRLVDQWADNPNVTAIIYAHIPGQDSGRALVSLLYGESNFSGKMPYTVAHNESDYGAILAPTPPTGIYTLFPQSNFTEGVYIDYRAFDKAGITPRYEFGFGLSYTTFSYSDLTINALRPGNSGPYPLAGIVQGGAADLWDAYVYVTAKVTNTGAVVGQEVLQLYVGIPGGPVKQLRGFEKVAVQNGKTVQVGFTLSRRDLSVWDTGAQKWLLQSGTYQIYVGGSSRNLPLQGSLNLST